jgi:hypothetical protein
MEHPAIWITVGAVGAALAMTIVGYCMLEQRSEAVAETNAAQVAKIAAMQEKEAKANAEKEARTASPYRAAQSGEVLKAGDAVTAELLAPTAFDTNPQGTIGRDALIIDSVPARIVFRTASTLTAGTGLSVAAAWPKDVAEPLHVSQQAHWWGYDELPFVVAMMGVVPLIGFYLIGWWCVGRGPPPGIIVPQFDPPYGMSAAAVRYVARKGAGIDARALTAAVLDMAVRGHLRLVDTDYGMQVEQRAGGGPLDSAEWAVEAALFSGGTQLPLSSNRSVLDRSRTAMEDIYAQACEGWVFRHYVNWWNYSIVLSLGILAEFTLSILLIRDSVDGFSVIVIIMFSFSLAPWFITAFVPVWHPRPVVFWLIALSAGALGTAALNLTRLDLVACVVALLLALVTAIGFRWFRVWTVEGRQVMDRIEGFRRYLANDERIDTLGAPEKTPQRFAELLPYAVALDVEGPWARSFAGVPAAAATGTVVASWYTGNLSAPADPASFAHNLGHGVSKTIATAAYPPTPDYHFGADSGSGGGGC